MSAARTCVYCGAETWALTTWRTRADVTCPACDDLPALDPSRDSAVRSLLMDAEHELEAAQPAKGKATR